MLLKFLPLSKEPRPKATNMIDMILWNNMVVLTNPLFTWHTHICNMHSILFLVSENASTPLPKEANVTARKKKIMYLLGKEARILQNGSHSPWFRLFFPCSVTAAWFYYTYDSSHRVMLLQIGTLHRMYATEASQQSWTHGQNEASPLSESDANQINCTSPFR